MLDRRTPPSYTQHNTLKLLQPDQINLVNGAKVFIVRGGDQDVVRLELIFSAGRWFENFPGVSYFSSHLLSKGTKAKTSNQIAQALESLGLHLEITPGFDFVSVTLFGLTKRINDGLSILFEICNSPAYPEGELARFKNIFLQSLKVNREKTSYLAATTFREHLFGKNHPYGSEVNEGHVQNITPEILSAFHDLHFKHFVCFVTGKLPDTLVKNITETLNLLSFNPTSVQSFQNTSSGNTLVKIEKSGSLQASLRMGKSVIPKNNPDYPGLILSNHALGGYFGSRLMQSLREDKGLTYGVHSGIQSFKHQSYFVISTDINKEQSDFAIEEIKSEIRKFRLTPMGEDELQLVKNHFLGSLFTEINTPFAHTEKLKNIYLNQLDESYYQNLVEVIQHITSFKVMELVEKHLHEEKMLIICAG